MGSNSAALLVGTTGTSYSYSIALIAGTSGTLTVGTTAGAISTTFSGGVTGSNNLTIDNAGSGTLTFATGAINNAGTVTNISPLGLVVISSVIGTNVTGVVQDSTNGVATLSLTGSNTYTGAVSISSGTLTVGTILSGATAQPLGEGNTINLGIANASSGTLLYTGPSTLGKNIAAFSRQ